LDLVEIWRKLAKLGEIREKVLRSRKNQNLASPKAFDFLQLCFWCEGSL